MASNPGALAWPVFAHETLDWQPADADYGPRASRSRHTGPYAAAVPTPIATAVLSLDGPTQALVAEATAEIARLDGEALGPVTAFAPLLLRTEASSSSQIEDLTSSAKAVALAELGRHGRSNADAIVANVEAMTTALDESGERLDADAILTLHRVLMREQMPAAAGRWRGEPVWIGGSARSPHGADYVAPRHDRVPAAIDDLVRFAARDDLAVLVQAAVTHAQFESIHPFPDGNGRVGRALLHAQLRRGGLARHIVVPVSAGFLADPGGYVAALTVYRDGDPQAIVRAVSEAVFPALANSRQLMDDVRDARARWDECISARRGAAAWRLADLLVTRPVVDSALVAAELGVTLANAQGAIDRLVEDGVIAQIGNGARNRVWQAPEIIEAMEAFASRAGRRH